MKENSLINWIPVPLPKKVIEDIEFIQYQTIELNQQEKRYFIFGEFVPTAPWYYLPVMFLIKVPIPIILLILGCGLLYVFRKFEVTTDEVFIIAPFIIMIIPILTNKNASGLRYILFLFPLLFVFLSRIITYKWPKNKYTYSAGIVIFLWIIISSIIAFPFHFSYFNEFIGRIYGAYDKFADADIDYGLDTVYMQNYVKESKEEILIEPCPITYDIIDKKMIIAVNSHYFNNRNLCFKDVVSSMKPQKILGSWVLYDLSDLRKVVKDEEQLKYELKTLEQYYRQEYPNIYG